MRLSAAGRTPRRPPSRSLRYLIRKLSARKFAEVEPEDFYVFSRVRPRVRLDQDGTRRLRWPSNTFYSWHDEATSRDMVFLVGAEPNLTWNTYAQAIMEVAHTCDVARMVVLGSLLDATPHTREPGITGLATDEEVREALCGTGGCGLQVPGAYGCPLRAHGGLRRAGSQLREHVGPLAPLPPGLAQPQGEPHAAQASAPGVGPGRRPLRPLRREPGLRGGRSPGRCRRTRSGRATSESWRSATTGPPATSPEGPQEELPEPDVVIKDLEDFLQQQRGGGPATPPRGDEPEA